MMRIAIAVLATFFASVALAQSYPTKPIRFVVATGPGGGDDFVARLLAPKLSEFLGQQVFVENRPGAGGMVGQSFVAKSPADGYTVLLAGGSMAGAKFVNAAITYDLMRDFTPISLIETAPFALVVGTSVPARSVAEFITFAKSRPGQLNYGTLGAGQIPFWAALLFNSMAGVQAQEIQYKSPAEATTDVMTARIHYWFSPMATALGAKDKVRVLGVTTPARVPQVPEAPAIAETLTGFQMPAWRSMMGPAGLNADIVQALNRAVARSLEAPEIRERMTNAGSIPQPSTPAELRKRYEEWVQIFGKIAQDTKLQPQ
jgi:tripartite-type tricarboxylate transporter receptor subunit TctC